MLYYCWPTVADGGPTLIQHCWTSRLSWDALCESQTVRVFSNVAGNMQRENTEILIPNFLINNADRANLLGGSGAEKSCAIPGFGEPCPDSALWPGSFAGRVRITRRLCIYCFNSELIVSVLSRPAASSPPPPPPSEGNIFMDIVKGAPGTSQCACRSFNIANWINLSGLFYLRNHSSWTCVRLLLLADIGLNRTFAVFVFHCLTKKW